LEQKSVMRDPWILIAIGVALVGVPMWVSHWEAGRVGRRGGIRDRVQTIVRSDPTTMHFIAGLRIGVELAGAILIGIGVMRIFGVAI
jgi:hypothetical protein